VFRQISAKKFEVKVYKTDRALTGKDKSNRAKRWEVLAGDFQHATLEECWSAERKLIMFCFNGFGTKPGVGLSNSLLAGQWQRRLPKL
jgi:hypothetical protein